MLQAGATYVVLGILISANVRIIVHKAGMVLHTCASYVGSGFVTNVIPSISLYILYRMVGNFHEVQIFVDFMCSACPPNFSYCSYITK